MIWVVLESRDQFGTCMCEFGPIIPHFESSFFYGQNTVLQCARVQALLSDLTCLVPGAVVYDNWNVPVLSLSLQQGSARDKCLVLCKA